MAAEHLKPRLPGQGDDSERNRNVHVGGPGLQRGPRRLKVRLGAEPHERNRQRRGNVPHHGRESRIGLEPHVFGEGKQHRIAKHKPGDTEFQRRPAVAARTLLSLRRSHTEIGCVTHKIQALREVREGGFLRIEPQLRLFLAELHPHVNQARLHRRPGLYRLHARRTVHGGQVQLHDRHSVGLVPVEVRVQNRVVERGVGAGFHNAVKFRPHCA